MKHLPAELNLAATIDEDDEYSCYDDDDEQEEEEEEAEEVSKMSSRSRDVPKVLLVIWS
jgi:hypothetical protein